MLKQQPIHEIIKKTMFNQTKVLLVKKDSIRFEKNDSFPIITDEETENNLKLAADELITTNNVVAFPTETVYGLGGDALKDESVRSIYKAKNRPSDNPLIIHISSIDQLKRKLGVDEIPLIYKPLIDTFWPGPLTILLPIPKNSSISNLVTASQPTFAVRMPNHPIARALIAISDLPLAAPSANASTRPSPTLASHVYHDLNGKIPIILDGGSCDVGVESTVVDGLSSPPMLLRPGGISLEEIKLIGGELWKDVIIAKKTAGKAEPVKTPGMKYKHYSPDAKVVLFINCSDGKEAINKYLNEHNFKRIALLKSTNFLKAEEISPDIEIERDLGATGKDILHNLFKYLREVDELGVDVILVEGVSENDQGLAIMNRLSKAASEIVSN